jgi:aryl-alcohol dehydrogenase-like predicted oxidoreductase
MQQRRLGRSGIEVGAIGLGCWAIGGAYDRTDGTTVEPMGWGAVDDDESIRAIRRGIELGITFFDTANNYGAGRSERVLGQALAGRRDGVVIATKFGSIFDEQTRMHFDNRTLELTAAGIGEALEASLRRLQTDWVDLYLLHAGQAEPERALQAIPVLEDLVADGKIRAYGWSTDDPARAEAFAAGEHCAAIEFHMSLSRLPAEMLAVCTRHDLAGIVKQPLNSGVLTGKFTAETTFGRDDGRYEIDFTQGLGAQRLEQIEQVRGALTEDGTTMAQAAVAWVLTRSDRTIPIPGFKTVDQVEDLAGAAARVPLTDEAMATVARVFDHAAPTP